MTRRSDRAPAAARRVPTGSAARRPACGWPPGRPAAPRLRVLVLALLLLASGAPWTLAAGPGGSAAEPDAPGTSRERGEHADERSTVLVLQECESSISRRELTLFANGTVRLRQGPPGEESMALGELAPDVLAGWTATLRDEDLSEVDRATTGPGGDWAERCRLELHYGAMEHFFGAPPKEGHGMGGEGWPPDGSLAFEYGRYHSLALPLSRAVAQVEGLMERLDLAPGRHTLPAGYEPRRGDVLRRTDGVLFRVVRATALGEGWELQGVQQPLALYVPSSEFPKLFVELVERR